MMRNWQALLRSTRTLNRTFIGYQPDVESRVCERVRTRQERKGESERERVREGARVWREKKEGMINKWAKERESSALRSLREAISSS